MATISYPTKNVLYYPIAPVYIRADQATTNRYLYEEGLASGTTSFVAETQRFSNDGGLSYVYWGYDAQLSGNTWKEEFGFSPKRLASISF